MPKQLWNSNSSNHYTAARIAGAGAGAGCRAPVLVMWAGCARGGDRLLVLAGRLPGAGAGAGAGSGAGAVRWLRT